MHKLLFYIKRYPLSLLVITTVLFLSFFSPPSVKTEITNLDKFAHFCMYAGLSGIIWVEFLRSHRNYGKSILKAWFGVFVCPLIFSGVVELMQEYLTEHRSGDWIDFWANTCGVAMAALFVNVVLRPRILNKRSS
jgi:VanZ like family.